MVSSTIVLYPFPAIGHLVSMVELAKLIHTHHPSLSILILITPEPFETGSTDKYIKTVTTTTTPSITFHHLPTVTRPPRFPTDYLDIAFEISELYNPIVRNTLVEVSKKSTIKAVILDIFTNAGFKVSKSLDLPTYYFYTMGASGLCEFLYFDNIHKITSKSIKDLDVYFDIPGVPPIHASDMPMVVSDRESNSYKNFVNTTSNMAKSCGIIVNSFLGFEERSVEAIRDGKCIPDGPTPPIYLIGPLIAAGGANQLDPNENECLKWLNSQPSKSVVFLCFGSRGVFNKEQLKEIAIGLEKSGQRFLWVVRGPPGDENGSGSGSKDFDLEGFVARTVDKGMVVKNWAPQPAILGHHSVGGFVTHCGWNSTLEAVVAGVPMVAWPLYAEQKMNRVFLVEEMKGALAVEMSSDGFVTAGSVEVKVRELMEGEEGKMVRKRVLEMSKRAKTAVEDNGSSLVEFSQLTRSWIEV